jgi:Rod binding domain-containing protein
MLPLSGLGLASLDPASNELAPLESSGSTSSSPSDVKLRKAAGEFEAILLESLWKSMKETFKAPDDENSDPTLESFDDWGIQGMASAVGSSGGLGIKNMIIKYLEPRVSPVKKDTPSVPQGRALSAESH